MQEKAGFILFFAWGIYLHNPLYFSFLCNFLVFFLRIPIFLRTFAPISNVEFKSERNMEEKKYHIDESEIAGDKAASSVSWDEAYDTDSYPMGRSLEQVM